jgi:hypothetical protein
VLLLRFLSLLVLGLREPGCGDLESDMAHPRVQYFIRLELFYDLGIATLLLVQFIRQALVWPRRFAMP